MSEQATAMADYTLTIRADSGYESTTEGQCNACQYGEAIAALHGRPNTATELRTQRDELVNALKAVLHWIDDNCETTGFEAAEAMADAALAKAGAELFNA